MKTIFFSLFFFFSVPSFGDVVSNGLKQVSLNDKLLMKEFIKQVMKWDAMGHVIFFDNKPACLTSCRIKSPDKMFMDILWLKGWKAFKKNEHLFPHPNFIFNCSVNQSSDNWVSVNLFIINKKTLIKCFNDNSCVFRKILGNKCSINWLIDELESQKSVYEVLNNDERLIGILLGYGEESATAFYQAINSTVGIPPHSNHYCPVEVKVSNGCKLFPIAFMGNPNSTEVHGLLATYGRELEEFWHIYRKQDALKLFLTGICNEKNDECFFALRDPLNRM